METKDNSHNKKNKLLTHRCDFFNDCHDHLSFIWKHNSISVDIRFFCNPPGREKYVNFDFFINGEHTLFRFLYNCYGCGTRGKIPELVSENFRLTFSATPHMFEIFEEQINQDDNQDNQLVIQDHRKDVWISVYKNYQSGNRYDAPFKDPKVTLWIKKSFNYQYSSDVLLFKYELYSTNLHFISPTIGNFNCIKIFDHCKPVGCGIYSYIGCEISDGKGDYRKLYWGRNENEDQTIFEIIRFYQSLRCYDDWKNYDQFQEFFKSVGVTEVEIDQQLGKEISGLGITREDEDKI